MILLKILQRNQEYLELNIALLVMHYVYQYAINKLISCSIFKCEE